MRMAVMGTCLLAVTARAEDGLVSVKSTGSVKQTVERLQSELQKANAVVFATVDHAAAAVKAGVSLRPTVVVIFGSPKLGSPLMQCAQTAGIDLPQKALVWEDEKGVVRLGYNDPQYVADRHGIKGCGAAVEAVRAALARLAEAATQP
jgi:uncharacterized protein (DUF302 family)